MTRDPKSQHEGQPELSMLGDLSAAFGDCVSSLAKVISIAVDLEIEQANLNSKEFEVMQLFCLRPEWTATQLVEKTSIDPAHISRLVTNLVDQRLLRRRRSRSDRRVIHLVLTDTGRQMISEAHTRIISYQAALLEDVSDQEMNGFLATSRKVIQNYTKLAPTQS